MMINSRRGDAREINRASQLTVVLERGRAELVRDFGGARRIGIDHVGQSEVRNRRIFARVNRAEPSDSDHRRAQFIHGRRV